MRILLVWLGCAVADPARVAVVVDACDLELEDTGLCVPCADDGQCLLGGNPCHDTVTCFHEESRIGFDTIGCDPSQEYGWPDASGCRCVDQRCAWSP